METKYLTPSAWQKTISNTMNKKHVVRKQQYNHGGLGTITILLAVATIGFIFYHIFNAFF